MNGSGRRVDDWRNDDEPLKKRRKDDEVPLSLNQLVRYYTRLQLDQNAAEHTFTLADNLARFYSTPDGNRPAKMQLKTNLTESDIAGMEVIGRFDRDFIMARLRGDLYVIDQRGDDEKYLRLYANPCDQPWNGYRKTGEMEFSLEHLNRYWKGSQKDQHDELSDDPCGDLEFHAKIIPDENKEAEMELKRNLKKSDIASMVVVGQFNRGFIIGRLRDDLFIIDQHASDEMYNFERLQNTAVFQSQKLLTPIPMGFSAAQEQLIIDRREVFQKNGFDFLADRKKPPGERFSLSAIPSCSSCTFDLSDVDEILAILDDDRSLKMYRPLKVRRIFANKACRKSVMIGKSLKRTEMEKILRHMAETDQPWNCPHGRPTVRHLLCINSHLCHED